MLEISGLSKRFADVVALDEASFKVKKGEVFGFLGANGAGKTTTMRIVLGLLKADSGTVTWEDKPAPEWPRKTWGYMPEDRGLYLRMPVLEQLVFFAELYGVTRRKATSDARNWLARFRISDYADRKAETLSKGNQQKVQYIATVLHDPEVLLMDEPFSGLDPVNASLLKSAFLEMRDAGKTIIFSTHQLDQAEELCDSVAIIDHGRIITAGPTREVKRSVGHQVVRIATSGEQLAGNGDGQWLHELPNVQVIRDGNDFTELRVDAGTDPQQILQAAMRGHGEVLRFEVADPSLEDVFVQLVGKVDTEESQLAPAAEGRP